MSTSDQSNADSSSFYRYAPKLADTWPHLFVRRLQVSNKATQIPELFCNSDTLLELNLREACNLRVIGNSAFRCPLLQTIAWPINPTEDDTEGVDHGTGSPQLQELGESSFRECNRLQELDLSQLHQLTSIGGSCFLHCKGLETIKMAPNLSRIGWRAFAYCQALREIHWNGMPLMKLGNDLFTACSQLTHLKLTELKRLRIIGNRVFKNCTGLESVEFPPSLEIIGAGAFYGCESLSRVTFASDCTAPTKELQIEQAAFAKCTSLTFFAMPNYVTRLAPLVFWECTKLETLVLSPTLETIGGSAMGNCISLKEVTLPSTMNQESIGPNAFFKCPLAFRSDVWHWHYPRHENDNDENIFDDGRLLPSIVTKVKIVSSDPHWFPSCGSIVHPNGKEAIQWVDIQGGDLACAIQLSILFPKATTATISMDRLIRLYHYTAIFRSDFRSTIDDRRKPFLSSVFLPFLFPDGNDPETTALMEKFGEVQLAHAKKMHQLVSRRVGIELPFEPFAFCCA